MSRPAGSQAGDARFQLPLFFTALCAILRTANMRCMFTWRLTRKKYVFISHLARLAFAPTQDDGKRREHRHNRDNDQNGIEVHLLLPYYVEKNDNAGRSGAP
jgi:hypothetical protein